jgi:hypothetical protein
LQRCGDCQDATNSPLDIKEYKTACRSRQGKLPEYRRGEHRAGKNRSGDKTDEEVSVSEREHAIASEWYEAGLPADLGDAGLDFSIRNLAARIDSSHANRRRSTNCEAQTASGRVDVTSRHRVLGADASLRPGANPSLAAMKPQIFGMKGGRDDCGGLRPRHASIG